MPGYHITLIPKGVLGDFSKIEEEFEEFKDAHAQQCAIMELVELSDMLGAIFAYTSKYHIEPVKYWHGYFEGDTTYEDLIFCFNIFKRHPKDYYTIQSFVYMMVQYATRRYNINGVELFKMYKITERAFLSGART